MTKTLILERIIQVARTGPLEGYHAIIEEVYILLGSSKRETRRAEDSTGISAPAT